MTQTLFDQIGEDLGKVETLREGLELFVEEGMRARNFSEATRKNYTSDLTAMVEFLEKRGIKRLDQVDLKHLESYQAQWDKEGYKPSTRRRKTFAIKTWFKYLHRQGVVKTNVTLYLIPPKSERQEPRFLSVDEYTRLLRACSHRPRDAAIIEVFLQTGMRLSELARLTLDDVDIPRRITRNKDNVGVVRVIRKGGDVQFVPLNYKASRALKTYLRVRPKVDHDALWVTKFKTAMTPRSIQYIVKKYLAEAGIKNASVHTLRHTLATHLVARKVSLKVVQDTLGHKDLSSTSIYVSALKEEQREALQEHAL